VVSLNLAHPVGLIVHHDVKTLTSSACTAGRLKMQDWKCGTEM